MRLLITLLPLHLLTTGCDSLPALLKISINGVSEELDDLLVVPPSGFAVSIDLSGAPSPVVASSLSLRGRRWGGEGKILLTSALTHDGEVARGILPTELALQPGSYTLLATARMENEEWIQASFDLAVRDYPTGTPYIGSEQEIWLDFEVDRDGDQQPDFADDLLAFGLGSPAAPGLSDQVRSEVLGRVVSRVESVYRDANPVGFPAGDPVDIGFHPLDPGVGEVSRICVGGVAPGSPNLAGSILLDPRNANRTNVECGTTPPTGIFPRGLLGYQNDPTFQLVFDALRTERGGTPIGEHPLDPVVLAPGFDPAGASSEEATRYGQVETGIAVFADALAAITAHETAHALGLVAPGIPGAGLYGGTSGPDEAHAIDTSGGPSPENFLMNAGGTFSFASLAGIDPHPFPSLRPIDHAYLRDRLVVDPRVQGLYQPPVIGSVTPDSVENSLETLTVTGTGFLDPPRLRLVNDTWTYELPVETFVSDTEVTGLVIRSQILPGLYDLGMIAADGQEDVLPGAVTVP